MSDPIIEAAARALEKFRQSLVFSPDAESVAKVVLAAVTPMIRAAALEEAAKMMEGLAEYGAGSLAAAIRTLKEQPVGKWMPAP